MNLSIGKFAEVGGVGVETVRFYQRKGLLPTPSQTDGIRRYGDEEVRRLRFIRMAQQAGFTLAEIAELLALDAGHDHARARRMASARIDMIDAKMAELQQARDSLARLAKRCAKAHGPCPILTAFE